jgi:putative hydrolase of HD superfamily
VERARSAQGARSASSRRAAIRACLAEAIALKDLPRAGWLRVGVDAPESVAAHSWGVAWLVLALCPPSLDRGHALALAVLHDLAEVRVGDITPYDRVAAAEKRAREQAALGGLVAPLARAGELRALFREYAARRTPESRFVHACDKLDMALQAHRYARELGVHTEEFVRSALEALADPELRALAGPAPRRAPGRRPAPLPAIDRRARRRAPRG